MKKAVEERMSISCRIVPDGSLGEFAARTDCKMDDTACLIWIEKSWSKPSILGHELMHPYLTTLGWPHLQLDQRDTQHCLVSNWIRDAMMHSQDPRLERKYKIADSNFGVRQLEKELEMPIPQLSSDFPQWGVAKLIQDTVSEKKLGEKIKTRYRRKGHILIVRVAEELEEKFSALRPNDQEAIRKEYQAALDAVWRELPSPSLSRDELNGLASPYQKCRNLP